MLLQKAGEGFTGKLAALVGIEDLRPAFRERLLQRLDAEAGIQGVGKPSGEHISAVPVYDRHKV